MLTNRNIVIFLTPILIGILVGLAGLSGSVARELHRRDEQISSLQREVKNLSGQLHDTVKTMHYLTDPDTIHERTINRLLGRE